MIELILISLFIAFPIAFGIVGYQQLTAEKAECPNCGAKVKLIKGSEKCSKCRVQVYKDSNGNLKFN